ncbi:hypothetical protein ACPA54_02065 [Uniformispora flossi]|uniref:hypothetical protein n=1 Tax=Uniformispora flossi TaxID=3390723 RepID=UPI003C30CF78
MDTACGCAGALWLLDPVVIVALFVVGAVLAVFLLLVLIALAYGMTLSGGTAVRGAVRHVRQQGEADEAHDEDDPDEPPPLPMFTWYEETADTSRRPRFGRSS